MRLLVLLLSLAMPVVSWFSQQAAFGPTNKEISDQYPTLVVAAGYAFAIWGLIFLWDVVFGAWQLSSRRGVPGSAVARIRLPAALGFALTALWMPVFSQQLYWLALLVIWSSLTCLAVCAVRLSRDPTPEPGQTWFAWLPLSLHAGWLSLAAFLNTAQVIGSLLLDHFGVLHPRQPIDGLRAVGALLVIAGALLVVRPWK